MISRLVIFEIEDGMFLALENFSRAKNIPSSISLESWVG